MNTCPVCKKTHDSDFNCCDTCRACSRRWKHNHYLKNLVLKHRIQDRRKHRYTGDENHITEEFLQRQFEDQEGKCHHCGVIMNTENVCTNRGRWLQRLDNAIGHSIPNCVWSCRSCNVRRVEQGNQYWLAMRRLEAQFFNLVHSGYYSYLDDTRGNSIQI